MGAKRRRYGQGTVRKRGATWQIAYFPVPGGRRVWETVGSETAGVTREVAEHALMERLVEIGRGHGSQFLGHRFDVTIREWQRNHVALKGLSVRAQELLQVALDCHLIPAFSGQYLHQISAGQIERYAALKMSLAPGEEGAVPVKGAVASARKKPLGRRSIEQQLSVLRQFFKWAKREGLVSENPVELVELSSPQRSRGQVKVLEQDQVRALMEGSINEERETMLMSLVALGLRLGEMLALQVSDLSAAGDEITIQRTLTTEKGKTVVGNYPKTSAGYRSLKLSPQMKMRFERQVARAKKPHKAGQPDFLFPNSRGKVRGEGNFRRDIWHPAREAAGLPETFSPHSLRHTYCSELIALGSISIPQIAYRMGHSSPTTTMSIYASVFKRHESDQADIADLYS